MRYNKGAIMLSLKQHRNNKRFDSRLSRLKKCKMHSRKLFHTTLYMWTNSFNKASEEGIFENSLF